MQYTVNGLSLYGDLFPWSATSAKARGSVRTGTGPAGRQALTMSADLVPLSSEKPYSIDWIPVNLTRKTVKVRRHGT